jgi:hypothetical protein
MAVRLSVLCTAHLLPPRKIPGTHFCQGLSQPHGHSAAGRIRSIDKSNGLIRNRTHDLPACSIMPKKSVIVLIYHCHELLDLLYVINNLSKCVTVEQKDSTLVTPKSTIRKERDPIQFSLYPHNTFS